MTHKTDKPEELSETDLDQVKGGVGLLLPAVQGAPEGFRSTKKKGQTTSKGDESSATSFASSAGGDPNV